MISYFSRFPFKFFFDELKKNRKKKKELKIAVIKIKKMIK